MTTQVELQEQFERALGALLEAYDGRLAEDAIVESLEGALLELRGPEPEATTAGSPRAPEVHYDFQLGPPARLIATYGDADSLREALPDLLELQLLCVALDPSPPMMADLQVAVRALGGDEVTLQGRVVHAGEETAIQLDRANEPLAARLRALPETIQPVDVTPPQAPASRAATRTSQSLARPDTGAYQRPTSGTYQRPQSGAFSGIQTGSYAPVPPPDPREGVQAERARFEELADLQQALLPLALESASGTVDLEGRDGVTMSMTLRRGEIIELERIPSRDQDTLERLLEGAGAIDAEQVEQARALAEEQSGSIVDALLDLGLMEYSQLRLSLKTRLVYLLRQLTQRPPGEMSFYEHETTRVRSLAPPLALAPHLFEASLRRHSAIDRDAIDRHTERFGNQLLALTGEGWEEKLPLEPKQAKTIAYLREQAVKLPNLQLVSTQPPSDTLSLVLTLEELGLLELRAFEVWRRQATKQREHMELMLRRLNTENHFEILGLHWSAYDEEIERAHEEVRAKYELTKFEHLEDAQGKLDRVRARLDEAYEVLRRAGPRRSYRQKLVDSSEVLNSIEIFRKQAEAAQMRREIDTAITYQRRVLELHPRDPTARQRLDLLQRAKRHAADVRKNQP